MLSGGGYIITIPIKAVVEGVIEWFPSDSYVPGCPPTGRALNI